MEKGLTVREQLELDIEDQMDNSYAVRGAVIGLANVHSGYRPLYPVTVYQLAGDDTSGIAGLLFPSGEFRPVLRALEEGFIRPQRFWEFDETLEYIEVTDDEGTKRVVGNSWTYGEVLWDGVAGYIDPLVEMVTEIHEAATQKARGTVFIKAHKAKVYPHVRMEDTNSVTGDWPVYGNGLKDNRTPGKIHTPGEGSAPRWFTRAASEAA